MTFLPLYRAVARSVRYSLLTVCQVTIHFVKIRRIRQQRQTVLHSKYCQYCIDKVKASGNITGISRLADDKASLNWLDYELNWLLLILRL